MLRIHRAVQAGEYPNARRIAEELEVSAKSIHRDIEFMRDRLGLPIEFEPKRNGYGYTEEVSAFPTVQITEGELLALLVAEKALVQYRGTTFEKPLVSAIRKMSESLPRSISLNLADWEQTISFRTSAEPILDLATFEVLSRAVVGHEQLRLRYRKPGSKRVESRLVDPWHLANVNGEWFLFAWCHLRKDVRTFVPARIVGVERTGERFKPQPGFSVERRLRDSFGVISGEGDFDVRIQFSDAVADYIREKRWHPSQSLKELADGGVELRLRLGSLIEIQRWILGWGGQARAVAPKELEEGVRRAAGAILDRYQAPPHRL